MRRVSLFGMAAVWLLLAADLAYGGQRPSEPFAPPSFDERMFDRENAALASYDDDGGAEVSDVDDKLCDAADAQAEPADAPFSLQEWLCVSDSQLFVGGHLQQGVNVNARSPLNPPGGFGNSPAAGTVFRADQYTLNQLYLSMGRAADTSQRPFDIGFQVDLIYGTDYAFFRSRGLEAELDRTNRWNSDTGSGFLGRSLHGLAMPQLFVELAYKKWRVKLGHFYNILGHEELIPTENFYYTLNYPLFFNGYGESVPVTGALAQCQLSQQWLVGGGFHHGQSNWEDNNDNLNGVVFIEWCSCEKDMYITYTCDIGAEDNAGLNDAYVQSVIFEWQFADKWGYTLNSSYGFEENVAAGGDTAYWYGFAQYFAHRLNEKTVVGIRYDLFDDIDGTRFFPRAGFPANAPGIYQSITLGLNYKPHPNLMLRPELRWDWFSADGALPPGPFDNGAQRSQFMAAVDLTITF